MHAYPWLNAIAALGLSTGGAYLLWTAAGPEGVTVTWRTGSELDTAGFNLWRTAPAGDGPLAAFDHRDTGDREDSSQPGEAPDPAAARRVNADLIPARGSALAGAEYAVVDTAVRPGATYVYQVEEIDASGNAHRLPDTITVRAGWPREWLMAEGLAVIALGLALGFRQILSSFSVRRPI